VDETPLVFTGKMWAGFVDWADEWMLRPGAADLKQAMKPKTQRSSAILPRPPDPAVAGYSTHAYYHALALAVRDRMQERWGATTQTYFDLDRKLACYLSAEFLMGPHLGNNLVNLGMEQAAREALAELGYDLDEILACEEEPGLGNGGLGRLAACYLDSLATLERPAIGYGIRYEFGIFDQEIHDGWQTEITDKWLRYGNPWEIAKPETCYYVNWGGHTEPYSDRAATGCAGFPSGWSRGWPTTPPSRATG
jgi:glucan phosphorylase